MDDKNNKQIKIEDLYPGQTPEWYAEAEANLKRYLEIILRIYQRRQAEGKHTIELDN